MKISKRSDIDPFIVMDVVRNAHELEIKGESIIHLEIGQPSTPAPQIVIDKAKEALDHDLLGYTVALGIEPLRQAIAKHYQKSYGIELDANRVVITPGSSAGFVLTFLVGFDKGARVAVPAPGYPCYRNILRSLDLEPVDICTDASTDYLLLPEHLESLDEPVDGVIVSSPSNPTGSMYSEQQLEELIKYCRNHEINFISDEIYHGINFSKPCISALQFDDDIMVINSFSKYFSMTGWRLGWMVVPSELTRPIERLMQNLFISTVTISQLAAVEAFNQYELLDGYVANYKQNRDLLLAGLNEAGINKIASPDGAFYLYADVSHLTDDSVAFCQRILAEIGVAVTPGVDVDPMGGHRTIRLSYAGDHALIEEASRRRVRVFSRF